MRDFALSALPFVIIAVCVALMCANHESWKDNEYYMFPVVITVPLSYNEKTIRARLICSPENSF